MNNFQEIIVLIIVAVAFSVAGYKLYKHFTNPLGGCSGCESDCSGCELQDLKKEIEENKRRKNA
ncbi:MAG: FeoB-associated Cys-rich membrane protein [Bacteroidetes bacterium HGW-Bacteroidetes-9]|nr:MAG: FeoB-associated Cys-rich membrane protein [Bacteroidetes bacterium HGW-Bacteroidetes-9]